MTRDPRIDEYIATAGAFAQPILVHVRELVHVALSGAQETIKWGMPHFMVAGKNRVGLAAFKAHAAVVIHNEERTGRGMGALGKLTSLADLPPDAELIARFQAGPGAEAMLRPKRSPRPELPVPSAFAAALEAAPAALKAFEGFAPSHRREYVEWITAAKREETQDRRIAQAIDWLAHGKTRNWKYEGR